MPKSKKIANSTSLDKSVSSAVLELSVASNDSSYAVGVMGKEAKKLALEVKKLAKKRSVLLKRKKTVATKVKKEPSATNRKELRVVVKEIASTTKLLGSAKTQKSVTTIELAALKSGQRKVNALVKAIEKTEKVLNKPKKKKNSQAKLSAVEN